MTQTTLNFGQALVQQAISKPIYLQKVYNTWQANNYNTLNQLITGLNANNDKRRVDQVKFFTGRQGGVEVSYVVNGAPTLSGIELTVPLSIASGASNNIRVGDTVQDNNHVKGYVVNKTASSITVIGLSGTLSASTNFTNGMTAAVYGNASKSKGSVGRESIYNIPSTRHNYTQLMRETAEMFRRDQVETWFTTESGGMWSTTQIDQAIIRTKRNEELTAYYGDRGIVLGTDPSDANSVTFTGGIRWSIINEGGMYVPLSAEIDEETFHDAIQTFADRRGGSTNNVVALMGSDFLRTLQAGVTKDYIVNAGDKNTFGGVKVEGLNVMEYNFLGQPIKFVVWDGFQAPEYDTVISSLTGRKKFSHSCLLMDLSPVGSPAGGTMPTIVNTYFGQTEYMGGFLKGFIEAPTSRGAMSGVNFMDGGFVTDTDAFSYNLYCDRGYHIHADNMLLFELAA